MAESNGRNLDDLTVAELRDIAGEHEITGRSTMRKEELVQSVKDAEGQIGRMQSSSSSQASTAASSSSFTDRRVDEDEGESTSGDKSSNSGDSSSSDKPWKEGSSSSSSDDSGSKGAGAMTAPSIGPNTVIEHRPPEERLDHDKISDIDAMGLDKRRTVQGRRYGASPLKQLAVYGTFFLVVAALVFGGKLLADELDRPPDTIAVKAPWAQGEQIPPGNIDFPPATNQ